MAGGDRCGLWMLVVWALSCGGSEPTQIVIVVDTDLDIPSELDAVRFEVEGPNVQLDAIRQSVASIADPRFPLTLVLKPQVRGQMRVRVSGERSRNDVVVQERAFVPVANEIRSIYIFLSRACRDSERVCGPDMTCHYGFCEQSRVEPGAWPPTSDAGRVDATLPDADLPDADTPDVPVTLDGGIDGDVCADCECMNDQECGAPPQPAWGACEASGDECSQTGRRQREVLEVRCVERQCVSEAFDVESEPCPLVTDGNTCAAASSGPWSTCYVETPTLSCSQAGIRHRVSMMGVCSDGACSSSAPMLETVACIPETDRWPCEGCSLTPCFCDSGTCLRDDNLRTVTGMPSSGGLITLECQSGAGSCSSYGNDGASMCEVGCPTANVTVTCEASVPVTVEVNNKKAGWSNQCDSAETNPGVHVASCDVDNNVDESFSVRCAEAGP